MGIKAMIILVDTESKSNQHLCNFCKYKQSSVCSIYVATQRIVYCSFYAPLSRDELAAMHSDAMAQIELMNEQRELKYDPFPFSF
jgi:hypothetical protein